MNSQYNSVITIMIAKPGDVIESAWVQGYVWGGAT